MSDPINQAISLIQAAKDLFERAERVHLADYLHLRSPADPLDLEGLSRSCGVTHNESEVIRLWFRMYTLTQIARIFKVSRKRVVQMKDRATKKFLKRAELVG